jgi:DNA-binding response OmpR family regulator
MPTNKNLFLHDKILICEDDVTLRENIRTMLELHDFHVFVAANGLEAIKLLNLKRINLVITDWMMPEMTGIELLSYIKRTQNIAHIPVILLTARSDKSDKYEALKAMAEDYITKPFDMQELLLKCRNHIESRKLMLATFILEQEGNVYEPRDQKFIQEIKDIIHQNISNEKLSLADFMQRFNMSKSSFQKNVKRVFGMSIFDLVIETRLSRAKEILEQDAMNVADVVLECGFKNHNFFTKKFKEKYGILPSKIRQNISSKLK